MRIAVISEYVDEGGGTPTILSNLVRHLQGRYPDLHLEVISSRNLYRGSEKLPRFQKLGGVRVVRLNTPKSNRDSTMLRLLAGLAFTGAVFWRLLRHCPYDALLIVTNPPTLPLAIRAIKKIKRVPYLYLIHDLYPDVAIVLGVLSEGSRAARIFHRAQKGWMHGADRTLMLGRDMRDHLVSTYQMPAARIEVVPNWCDPDEVRPLPTSGSRFREESGLEGVVALYAGNFGHYQTFDDLLDAAAILRDEHPEISIALVGGGAQDDHIRRRVEGGGLTNVHVFPMQSQRDYPDVLCAADIALVTLALGAEGAGVPSKFYNILASGRATVAVVAPHSEVARVLNESNSGVQINQNDPKRLAQVLLELADDAPKRARMGENARRTLEANYTLEHVGGQFYDVLRQTVGGHRQ